MGINTSLSLQESWHLPPSSISLDGQTLGSQAGPRDYSSLSSFLSSLPLSFSPFSQFTHVPSTRGTTNANGVSGSAVKATSRSQKPCLRKPIPRGAALCRGTILRFYRAWRQLQQRRRQWQRPYRRRPTALETKEKRQRQ